jgi:hypothetical protein
VAPAAKAGQRQRSSFTSPGPETEWRVDQPATAPEGHLSEVCPGLVAIAFATSGTASLQKNVSWGPHAIHMENRERSIVPSAEQRLGGHVALAPSGVLAQSTSPRRAPTSPPAAKISSERRAGGTSLTVWAFEESAVPGPCWREGAAPRQS